MYRVTSSNYKEIDYDTHTYAAQSTHAQLTSLKAKVILSGFCSSSCEGCLVTFMSPIWMEYTLEDSLGTSSEPGNVVGRKFSRLLNSM